jgi:hypothetical protein
VSVNRLGELLDAAAEVPQRYRTPPLAGIRRRVRRRRATIAAAASAVLVVAVLGGLGIARAVAVGPDTGLPAGPGATGAPSSVASSVAASGAAARDPLPAGATAVPWAAALVLRDDRTITVHSGAGGNCKQLVSPRAEVTVQNAVQVVIAVHALVVAAADCSVAANNSVQLTVTLPADLGTRTVWDPASGFARTVYHERYLPQLPADQWSPVGATSWPSNVDSWYRTYDGPDGGEIVLTGSSQSPGGSSNAVAIGSRLGLIGGSDKTTWWVTWQVDGLSYSLRYVPAEGGSMTLDEFKRLLTTLAWS